MFNHGSCGTDCLWCTVCKRGKKSFISWHAVPCVQSCSSHSYFLRLHCYINWSFDPERDWNNEWKTQPNDKTAARIRPKKKILFGSGFRPTLSIYVRPKLFYELDTVMRWFNTHTFSAVFPQFLTTVAQSPPPLCCFKHDTGFGSVLDLLFSSCWRGRN